MTIKQLQHQRKQMNYMPVYLYDENTANSGFVKVIEIVKL